MDSGERCAEGGSCQDRADQPHRLYAALRQEVAGRYARKIGAALGFTDFGITGTRLGPSAWSSQRHCHEDEDELVVMIEGEAVLVEEDCETVMRPGDIAAFRKGVANGHHFINRGDRLAGLIAVGRVANGHCHYHDIDLHLDGPSQCFVPKSERSA